MNGCPRGLVAWLTPGEWTATPVVLAVVIGMAIAAVVWTTIAPRHQTDSACEDAYPEGVRPSHVLAALAVVLLGLVVSYHVVNDWLGLPHHDRLALGWLAWGTTCVAVAVHLWDATARFPPWCLYAQGFILEGLLLVQRDLPPGRFFVWTGICELAGLLLVAGLLGWIWRRFPVISAALKMPGGTNRWCSSWFCWAQAIFAALAVLLIVWILVDPSYDRMGEDKALLGLSGHWASCPASLMLLGTTIVMAWQTCGMWRGFWQYAAMFAGLLFTSSIGWARVSTTPAEAWSQRVVNLLVSTSMMTLLTRFGLARVLPWSGDWITRARRAAPVFGTAALLLAIIMLIRWSAS